MVEDGYFIDTNIIIYARGREHPYRNACSNLILAIGNGSFERKFGVPVVDSEVFQKIIYRYALIGKWETAISVTKDLYNLGWEILSVGSGEVVKMIELAEIYGKTGVSPRDLVHGAVMINNGIRNIITADTHFDQIKEIKRIDPFTLSI